MLSLYMLLTSIPVDKMGSGSKEKGRERENQQEEDMYF